MLANLICILLTAILLGCGGAYLFAFVRYITSGKYIVDKRFMDVTR
jgi:C4-dicarboxylate transporter